MIPRVFAMHVLAHLLAALRTSYRLGTLFVCFLHFKMKMTQPLVYSGVSGIVDLVFNPLVQIYLFGQAAEGAYRAITHH